MAEPSVPGFGAPARRPVGRLGLVVLLALGVVILAVMTQAGAADRAGPADHDPADHDAADPDPAVGDDPAAGPAQPQLAFGSVTADGAIVFRLGEPVHAWSVDAEGTVRWERDLDPADALVCGPCPAALARHAGGRASAIAADGSTGPAPDGLDGSLVEVTSIGGVVLAVTRPDDRTELLVPTSAGLASAGSLADARLAGPLAVVTPATGAPAAMIMRTVGDPLRQAEFEVVHVTPSGPHAEVVALDEPGSRPMPCVVAGGDSVAYLQLHRGPTSAGSTHVVVRPDDGPATEATVPGSFDTCAAGPGGVVLASAVTGADGDPAHTVVEVVWLAPSLGPRAEVSEAVAGSGASVAIDAASGRVAVAGGTGPAVLLDGDARRERPPAAAVAFDDRGGLWSVDTALAVRHEATP